MHSPFDYTDYRLFLQDRYEAAKAADPSVTHRLIADKVGFKSSGFFTQIIQGKSNISDTIAQGFARFFELNTKERDYFLDMVRFNQSSTHGEKQTFFERMLAANKKRVSLVEAKQYAFYEKWYYSAVREALAFVRVTDAYASYVELAKTIMPPIKPLQAKRAIRLLLDLGMAIANDQGEFERTDQVISGGTQARSVAITACAMQMIDLAKSALADYPRDQRSISALTLSMGERSFRELEEKMALFRREILEAARRDEHPDRVYQLNMQLFPLTKKKHGGRGK
jgi:uncharacterized protein (TIGR02147 family)